MGTCGYCGTEQGWRYRNDMELAEVANSTTGGNGRWRTEGRQGGVEEGPGGGGDGGGAGGGDGGGARVRGGWRRDLGGGVQEGLQ